MVDTSVITDVKRKQNVIKRSTGEKIFDTCNIVMMCIVCFITLYPFWYVTIQSFNEGNDSTRGALWFWPRAFTLENYQKVLSYSILRTAYVNTILRTVSGSILSLLVTGFAAFAMTKRNLPGRSAVIVFFMIPMFIGGTMISGYLVISAIHMMNKFWVYIIPGAFNFFYMLVMRTYFYGIPISLEESAKIDGAGYFRIFFTIIVPLSMPVIATILLFNGVGHWLDFYTNLLYVKKTSLAVAQYILYMVVQANQFTTLTERTGGTSNANPLRGGNVTPESLKMAILVFVTLPILMLYPFLQKYFIKGVLIGAVKE